jgi:hypothetical protein
MTVFVACWPGMVHERYDICIVMRVCINDHVSFSLAVADLNKGHTEL